MRRRFRIAVPTSLRPGPCTATSKAGTRSAPNAGYVSEGPAEGAGWCGKKFAACPGEAIVPRSQQ